MFSAAATQSRIDSSAWSRLVMVPALRPEDSRKELPSTLSDPASAWPMTQATLDVPTSSAETRPGR
jgi:hypothetical protein